MAFEKTAYSDRSAPSGAGSSTPSTPGVSPQDRRNAKASDLAHKHVHWFLETIRPILITHMIHGFKHGVKHMKEEAARETRFPDKYCLACNGRMTFNASLGDYTCPNCSNRDDALSSKQGSEMYWRSG